MSDPRTEAAVKRLESTHWDGTGCGTNSDMGCAHCYGPSPADAHEIVRDVLAAADEADRAAGIVRVSFGVPTLATVANAAMAKAAESPLSIAEAVMDVLRWSVEGQTQP